MKKNRINEFYIKFKPRDYIEDNFKDIDNNKCIDCSLGINPFEKKRKNIISFFQKSNEYPNNYYKDLKNMLLKKYQNINNTLNEDEIAFGQGSMGVIRNIFEFLLQPNDIVLGYSPQFPRVISEIELKNAKHIYYSLTDSDNFRFCANEFIKMVNENIKVIYIDNPNNPTGQVIDIIDLEKIIKVAQKFNTFILIDEAYGDYMDEEQSAISLINKYSNLIVVKSFSKFYGMPEHRIGYMFADKEIVDIYNNISLPFPFSDFAVSILKQKIKDYKKISVYRKRTQKIKEKIVNNINTNNYLYTDMRTPILTVKSEKYDNLYKELLKNGILAENCSQYINLNEKYVRIRINKKYKKVIKILNKVL